MRKYFNVHTYERTGITIWLVCTVVCVCANAHANIRLAAWRPCLHVWTVRATFIQTTHTNVLFHNTVYTHTHNGYLVNHDSSV